MELDAVGHLFDSETYLFGGFCLDGVTFVEWPQMLLTNSTCLKYILPAFTYIYIYIYIYIDIYISYSAVSRYDKGTNIFLVATSTPTT